jgi:hypothetical protein
MMENDIQPGETPVFLLVQKVARYAKLAKYCTS